MKTRRSPDSPLREAIAFSLLPKIGCKAFRAGVEQHGSAAAAFRVAGKSSERDEALHEADTQLARAEAASASVMLQGEANYPATLLDLGTDAPCFLYALGDTGLAGRRCVGIVGTRHSSPSGERIACEMAAMLAREGIVVVSGMALGIDAAAHRGALDAGGGTIAVLGGGVDKPYPPRHAMLHRRIVGEGLAVSEAPMGSNPVLGAFPRRNRIIAAMSAVLIVVEAGERSGALITSRLALDLGRTVAAVPGPIDSPRHVGSNRLLSEGASFVARIEDVLSLVGVEKDQPEEAPPSRRETATNDPAHSAILNAVRAGASDLEDLARSARLTPRAFTSAISTLEMAGLLRVTSTGGVAVPDRA